MRPTSDSPSSVRVPLALQVFLAFVVGFALVLCWAMTAHAMTAPVSLQDPVPPTSPLGALAYAVLLPVVAWIATKLYDGLKTIIPAYDKLPATVHMIAAPLFQAAFGWVASATGAAVLTDIHSADAGWIGAVLTALLAAGIKRYEKAKTANDATVVLEATRASGSV